MTKRAKLEALRNEIIRIAPYRQDIGEVHANDGGGFTFETRYVGDWMVPADEEDDGDYDWKVPTPATVKMFDALCEKFGCRWFNQGEKCYVDFYIE